MGFEEELDEQASSIGPRVVADLVIAGWPVAAQFQPVSTLICRPAARRSKLRLQLAGQHRQHRVMAQFVVVVQVLA